MNPTPAFLESEVRRSAGDVDASSVLSIEQPARQEPMMAHLSFERASRMGRRPDAGVFSKNLTRGARGLELRSASARSTSRGESAGLYSFRPPHHGT